MTRTGCPARFHEVQVRRTTGRYVAYSRHWLDNTRLFADTGPVTACELVQATSTPKGVTIQVYR